VCEVLSGHIPKLLRGCRLTSDNRHGDVLLVPEGMLRLSTSAKSIVQLFDGVKPVSDIVDILCERFPSIERKKIENDVCVFIEQLYVKRFLDLV